MICFSILGTFAMVTLLCGSKPDWKSVWRLLSATCVGDWLCGLKVELLRKTAVSFRDVYEALLVTFGSIAGRIGTLKQLAFHY